MKRDGYIAFNTKMSSQEGWQHHATTFTARALLPFDLDADIEDGQQLLAPGFQGAALPGLIQVRVKKLPATTRHGKGAGLCDRHGTR
jgi:hypothetical protein